MLRNLGCQFGGVLGPPNLQWTNAHRGSLFQQLFLIFGEEKCQESALEPSSSIS
jgi:hypothetical protein